MENKRLFNRQRIFTIDKSVLLCEETYNYWPKENDKQSNGHFYRQELFALKNQFI